MKKMVIINEYIIQYVLHICIKNKFVDLEQVDEEIYRNLRQLLDMKPDEVEYLCLDFTVTEETMGMKQTVDLVPGGGDIDVTGENLPEYMEAMLQYKLMGRVKPQLNELLLGFHTNDAY